MAREKKNAVKKNSNSANLSFKEKLWTAANKLRGHMDAGEYKHVVLGLIFLKYISDAFQKHYEKRRDVPLANPEDRDEYTALEYLLGSLRSSLVILTKQRTATYHRQAD